VAINFPLRQTRPTALGRNIGSLLRKTPSPFVEAFNNIVFYASRRFTKVDPISILINEVRIRRCKAEIDKFVLQLVRERLDLHRNGDLDDAYDDLLSGHVRMGRDPETGMEFDETYLRDFVMNFVIGSLASCVSPVLAHLCGWFFFCIFFLLTFWAMLYIQAGRDTTGYSLSFALYLIAKDPEVERHIVRELDGLSSPAAAAADSDSGVFCPNFTQVKGLKYLDAVVREVLRLYPPVWLDLKECVRESTLPSCGVKVQPGTAMVWSAWCLGRHPDYWGADAAEFKPERWIDTDTMKPRNPCTTHPWQWNPFQGGPRICLGKRMAMLEMKFVLACLLARYSFRVVDEPKLVFSVSVSAANGMNLAVSRRRA
jgi:cytochrome P450